MEPIKILLVDDSKSARYALRLQLQRHGVQVDTAESAEAALEQIRKTPPDAILMDHTMPGMNGFEALEILKSSLDTARIPVVMCSSHDDQNFSDQALRRGALGVLTKAVAAERLPQVLDQIRATLTQGTLPEATSIPEAVPEMLPPLPGGPSREEIEALVEDRLAAALSGRQAGIETFIENRLAAVLPVRLTETVDPLVARINAQLRQVIAEQVEMAVDALPPPAPAPVPPPPPPPVAIQTGLTAADVDRLRDEIIPEVVDQHLETELDRVLALMQQCVQEGQAAKEDPEAMQRALHSLEVTMTARATQIARDEIGEAMAASQIQNLTDTVAALQRRLRSSSLLGGIALLLALGAIALIFIRA